LIDPIRLSFEVDLPPESAFDLWVARTASWWPLSHTVTTEPGLVVVFQAGIGGRIFERTPAGEEHDWGQITVWEPPRRLGYLWHLRADRADATDVEIRFVELPGGRTRVDIEHRGWERLGAAGVPRRDANHGGWAGLLPHYIGAAAASG
jgi:uncharacterized protein YndB with AHSA1/START domain